MDELLQLLKRHDVRLILAVYPWPDQIYHHDLDSRQVRFWREWAQANSVPFLNYFPKLIDTPDSKEAIIRRFYIPGDIHFNEAGHRFIADGFLDYYRSFHATNGAAAR